MLLYLLRHAEASAYQDDDFSRRLTEKGITQAHRVGEFLAHHKIQPDLILSSPVLRAKETAEIVTSELGTLQPTLTPWIACGMNPDEALSELSAFKQLDSVMIVGHEPDFSSLCASLLGMETSAAINIAKASLTAIELTNFAAGFGVLKFLLPDKFI